MFNALYKWHNGFKNIFMTPMQITRCCVLSIGRWICYRATKLRCCKFFNSDINTDATTNIL